MSNHAARFTHPEKPKFWRPYLDMELKAEVDQFFAEHPELDPIGSITAWIRRGQTEHRRKHARRVT